MHRDERTPAATRIQVRESQPFVLKFRPLHRFLTFARSLSIVVLYYGTAFHHEFDSLQRGDIF